MLSKTKLYGKTGYSQAYISFIYLLPFRNFLYQAEEGRIALLKPHLKYLPFEVHRKRRLKMAKGLPAALPHQMFFSRKTAILQWQLMTHVNIITVLE